MSSDQIIHLPHSELVLEPMAARTARLLAFHAAKNGGAMARLFQAPGRVNLLGEHTDYSGGFCMPAALSFNTLIAASALDKPVLRLYSADLPAVDAFFELPLDGVTRAPQGHWAAYCAGVLWSLSDAGFLGGAGTPRGYALSITGNVPVGAGLSSSASIEVATATALLGLAGRTVPGPQIALACQRAENAYVGAPCGIMDQFISANGVKGHALAIDTRALTAEAAPIPPELRLVVANSMIKHSVADGAYRIRRQEVEEAASALSVRNPAVKQLRDATLAELEAAEEDMSREAFLRGRHVITDSQRVVDGVALLRAGDAAGYGRLMNDAHVSFRDDFAASCAECDLLVELAVALPGCLGSRLTGGGFGGCTVSLVEAARGDDFAVELRESYRARTGVVADVFICEIAGGAGEIVN